MAIISANLPESFLSSTFLTSDVLTNLGILLTRGACSTCLATDPTQVDIITGQRLSAIYDLQPGGSCLNGYSPCVIALEAGNIPVGKRKCPGYNRSIQY
ncbi:MAG: hypothetical protein WCJ58_07345 [bacterium]